MKHMKNSSFNVQEKDAKVRYDRSQEKYKFFKRPKDFSEILRPSQLIAMAIQTQD